MSRQSGLPFHYIGFHRPAAAPLDLGSPATMRESSPFRLITVTLQKKPAPPSIIKVLHTAASVVHSTKPMAAYSPAETKDLMQRSQALVKTALEHGAGTFVRYLHDLKKYPLLNQVEEYRYAKLSQAGNSWARDILVKHNLRFVITLAKKYATTNVPFEDLVQEGNIGLMRAVAKFDPDRGVKLVSYAAYWIEQAIRTAIAGQSRSVRLPANRTAELARVKKGEAELRKNLNRTPSTSEIAKMTDLSNATVDLLLRIGQDIPLDVQDRDSANTITWLDKLVSTGQADDTVEQEGQTAALGQLLSSLKVRDAEVLKLCFGLSGTREHTLEEVGIRLGISRERARQIRDRALRELQASPSLSLLSDFWHAPDNS